MCQEYAKFDTLDRFYPKGHRVEVKFCAPDCDPVLTYCTVTRLKFQISFNLCTSQKVYNDSFRHFFMTQVQKRNHSLQIYDCPCFLASDIILCTCKYDTHYDQI